MWPGVTELRTIPLFNGFTDEERRDLLALFEPAQPGPGGVLFEVGDTAKTFFLLTGGEVVLERPDDDVYRLRPPALIGELGALTGMYRNSRATVGPGATVLQVEAERLKAHLADYQELGLTFLVNLLDVVADKIQRDQVRMADMRQNLKRTQKELKRLREIVLEAPESEVSAPLHDTLERLITTNRRVNYRVEPQRALTARLRLDGENASVIDVSRTHLAVRMRKPAPVPTWLSGVLELAGTEIPVSGTVMRTVGPRVTIELDLMIDEYAAILEGYLTRAQLLDVLV